MSSSLEGAVDLFLARDEAEAMLEEVRQDEPELADMLRVEVISLGEECQN